MKKTKILLINIVWITIMSTMTISCIQESRLTPEEAKQIAKEAYVYGFPMVVNYKTLYNYTLNEESPEYKGPFNEISCITRLFTPDDKAVVTPNSDTPYCMLWVDLRDEPQVISVPKMKADRFYHVQLIDLYTHNFGYLGTLTTGNKAGDYLITKQDWKGETPKGIDKVLKSETDLFFVIIRTQLMNDSDIHNVKEIQGGYQLRSLNEYVGKNPIKTLRNENYPSWNNGDEYTVESFKYLNEMLKLAPTIDSEIMLRNNFSKLGLGTERGFDLGAFDLDIQKAIKEGVGLGLKEIKGFLSQEEASSSMIFGTREFLSKSAKENFNLDNYYLPRAVGAQIGLYANSGTEAIYPAYLSEAPGVPYDASKYDYQLVFQKDQLPPVRAFWSLSMYDGKTQLFIRNYLNRYLLNSNMMNDFVFGEDGLLTLYIQKDSPGADLESNWLPAPDGPFYCVLRLYGPEKEALNGEWVNPPMLKR